MPCSRPASEIEASHVIKKVEVFLENKCQQLSNTLSCACFGTQTCSEATEHTERRTTLGAGNENSLQMLMPRAGKVS